MSTALPSVASESRRSQVPLGSRSGQRARKAPSPSTTTSRRGASIALLRRSRAGPAAGQVVG